MSINHYENFPVASVLCPPALRPAVTAIYWFARTADDLADEGTASPVQRLAALSDYRDDLHAAIAGTALSKRWPDVFEPLVQAIPRYRLAPLLLEDLLSAFEQDVRTHRYVDRNDLLDYCRRSANPVGRLLLHLYGVTSAEALRQSDAICSALQLINFWQDLSIDISKGRVYPPEADCLRHGVTRCHLLTRQDSQATRYLIADLVHWARALMLEGAPLVHMLRGRAGWELRLVVQGGLRILEKIESRQYATLLARPRLRWYDMPLMLQRAICMRAASGAALPEAQP